MWPWIYFPLELVDEARCKTLRIKLANELVRKHQLNASVFSFLQRLRHIGRYWRVARGEYYTISLITFFFFVSSLCPRCAPSVPFGGAFLCLCCALVKAGGRLFAYLLFIISLHESKNKSDPTEYAQDAVALASHILGKKNKACRWSVTRHLETTTACLMQQTQCAQWRC